MESTRAVFTGADRDRLRRFISAHEQRLSREQEALARLRARVESAHVVDAQDVPPERVTLHSQIRLQDYERRRDVITTLTLPTDVQVEMDAPLLRTYPTASLLGAREGDDTVLPALEGYRHGRIDKVLFQPEGAGRRARKKAQHQGVQSSNTKPRATKHEEHAHARAHPRDIPLDRPPAHRGSEHANVNGGLAG
jgi:regulator of nucleoside diphosphate kinase